MRLVQAFNCSGRGIGYGFAASSTGVGVCKMAKTKLAGSAHRRPWVLDVRKLVTNGIK